MSTLNIGDKAKMNNFSKILTVVGFLSDGKVVLEDVDAFGQPYTIVSIPGGVQKYLPKVKLFVNVFQLANGRFQAYVHRDKIGAGHPAERLRVTFLETVEIEVTPKQ